MEARAGHFPEEPRDAGIPVFRLNWGAVFAGLVIAVVVQILLSMLGLAIGLGTIDFRTGEMGTVGVGAGIWALVTGLISLFVGGLAAGHMAGVMSRLNGVLHGVLVWGLSVIVALWALTSGVSTLLGGMFGVAGQTLSAAVGGLTDVGAALVRQTEGIPAPGQPAEQQIVVILEEQGMSRQQAQQAANRIQQTTGQVQLQAERIRRQAPAVATEAAGAISTAVWWVLLASVISLAAAAGGAALTAEK